MTRIRLTRPPHERIWIVYAVMLCLFATAGYAGTSRPDPVFDSLKKRLVADGFDAARIDSLYSEDGVNFDTKAVSSFFRHSEAKLNYDQFAEKKSIRKAQDYMTRHAEALTSAEKKYGVDKEIITAIILVETRLGAYVGKRSIFNTLSTMAALDDTDARERLWEAIPRSGRFTREKYEKKAGDKSGWAYGELKALLRYTEQENLDPLDINGSYAGAMGISQFMPSNALKLGMDGNNDGRIDLFDHTDAITSIANYLRHHNWRPGMSEKQAYRVILRYNYSKYYANTILKVAQLLKG